MGFRGDDALILAARLESLARSARQCHEISAVCSTAVCADVRTMLVADAASIREDNEETIIRDACKSVLEVVRLEGILGRKVDAAEVSRRHGADYIGKVSKRNGDDAGYAMTYQGRVLGKKEAEAIRDKLTIEAESLAYAVAKLPPAAPAAPAAPESESAIAKAAKLVGK